MDLPKGMKSKKKYKYLIYFQDKEFTELITKNLMEILYRKKVYCKTLN